MRKILYSAISVKNNNKPTTFEPLDDTDKKPTQDMQRLEPTCSRSD